MARVERTVAKRVVHALSASGPPATDRERRPKRLWTEQAAGPEIQLFHAYNEEEEAS